MLKTKIENILWILYRNFNNTIFDILLKSDGISSYICDLLKEEDVSSEIIYNIVQTIINNRNKLALIKNIPQVKQRSPEWFELRRNCLTASDTGQAMNRGHYGNRAKLIENKAFPEKVTFNNNSPPLKHGIMFEPMTARCYTQRNNDITIYEFGLIPHPTLKCYGASPDGITEMGVLIEIKTPWRRKVSGEILDQYELQMQGQMAVTGINECDFIDCEMEDMKSESNYINTLPATSKTDHGIIIEKIYSSEYIYSPEYLTILETIEWKNKLNLSNCKVIYWRMRKIYIERIYFDENRWNTELSPAIQQFWDDVIKARSMPIKIKQEKSFLEFIDSDDD